MLCVSVAHAEIGSVTESSGTAIIKRGKDTINIAKGTLVEMNDKVETKNGKVKITFKDNTTVNVTESSALVIDDFVYDPKSGAGKLNLKAAAGTVRYASGNIAHNNPNAVKINTPTAAIAVRGTDFIMAVNETGGSMVILMPVCETEQNINLKGLTCGSGAIDVETPAGIVKMNRPYQATMVETAGAMPTPPIIVSLSGMAVGNNLMINQPRTASGVALVAAARAAAEKTGDAKKDDNKKDSAGEDEKHVAEKKGSGSTVSAQSEDSTLSVKSSSEEVTDNTSATVLAENEYVKKIWKDKSETQQIGWAYESKSQNNRNYTYISLPIDTKVQVTVTQDMLTNSYNFSGGKAQGQIVINQSYR